MAKQSKVISRRKLLNPVFHLQTKSEEDSHLSKDVIKAVRKTGQLNLSGHHLSIVPPKMFTMYNCNDETAVDLDFGKPKNDDEAWWSFKPLTNIDLSSNVLQEIPDDIGMFQDLLVLNLQDNNLTSLPPAIGNLNRLTKLNLNHNKINTLPKEFYKLTDLQVLSINNNCLDSVDESITDFVMLEKLDLSNNSIATLPPGIGFLVRLSELNLSHNKLTELPPDIVNIRALLKLDVTHNNLKALPKMGELRKLQFLYAQHNDIEELPDFEGCENVQQLYLGNNFIKEVPVEFVDNMMHLKILELRDNQIESIPDEIAALQNLIRLDLANNALTSLPNSLGRLPHLQMLKVEGNRLKQIRADIISGGTSRIMKHLREQIKDDDSHTFAVSSSTVSHNDQKLPDRYVLKNSRAITLAMKNLSHLPDDFFQEAQIAEVTAVDLCKNKFSEIPSGLQIIASQITELNLSMNQIKVLPDFLDQCVKLKYLDLSNNMLDTLPANLGSLTLRELALANNKFSSIPECIYGITRLEILILNDNQIGEINIEGLQNLKQLATLNLSNNNISHVPPELGNMKQLRFLDLKCNIFRQPRYAILEQGTESVLSYLRDRICK